MSRLASVEVSIASHVQPLIGSDSHPHHLEAFTSSFCVQYQLDGTNGGIRTWYSWQASSVPTHMACSTALQAIQNTHGEHVITPPSNDSTPFFLSITHSLFQTEAHESMLDVIVCILQYSHSRSDELTLYGTIHAPGYHTTQEC